MKKQQLENLNGFLLNNNDVLKNISGGSAASDSKKKDVTSDKQDSASGDHYDTHKAILTPSF